MALLRQHLRNLAKGAGGACVLVTGPSGIGKTSLLSAGAFLGMAVRSVDNRDPDTLTTAAPLPTSIPTGPRRRPLLSSFAARLFGYDVFISFALGGPSRGTQSYASDLARRLRERDLSVFFSEEEAPPGSPLGATLTRALLRSKLLVVVVRRGTLQEPRWVRNEVETYRKGPPARSIIPVCLDDALRDGLLSTQAQEWLQYADHIWLDEQAESASM